MGHSLIQRAQSEGTPLVDGDQVTFVWQGESAPLLAADFSDWERGKPVPLERAGKALWVYRTSLPRNAYLEYAYLDPEDLKTRLPDRFNPRITPNGIGDNNHYFYMPEAEPTPLAQRRRGLSRGRATHHRLRTWGLVSGKQRSVYLYQPPVSEPCPLVVVWDGRDYLRRARLPVILDNLIAEGRIPPLALAMVQNGGKARTAEYACSEATLAFLQFGVLPLARRNLNLIDVQRSPASFGVMGASMGGLMALYTGLRLPHIFGYVLSQSGAFALGEYDTIVYNLARNPGKQLTRVWMDVGIYDFQVLLAANRRMQPILEQNGYPLEYREYPAGHNYPAWRDDLWRGLEWLFSKQAAA